MKFDLKQFSAILFFTFYSIFVSAQIPSTQNKIVFLGDSLTEGYGVAAQKAYPALVEKKLHADGHKNWQVINSGISGSTTASAVGRVDWVLKSKPQIIVLVLGANDALRGFKVDEVEKNLGSAIEKIQKAQVQVILAEILAPPNYGKKYSDQFVKIYQNLIQKYKVPKLPFLLLGVAGETHLNLEDGIHPNEKGHEQIVKNIYPAVLKQIQTISKKK